MPIRLVCACLSMVHLGVVCAGAASARQAAPARLLPGDAYKDYQPPFARSTPELMKQSLQADYYNRAYVADDKECIALVLEGIKRETAEDYTEAIRRYQAVIEKHPGSLIPAGGGGAFVSASQLVQHRILGFPAKRLDYYRLRYDAQAREIFQRALKSYNVLELHHVADTYLATTSGTKALYELGRRALDGGHPEEAACFFRRILQWHRPTDVDQSQVKFLLGYALRLRGQEAEFQALRKEMLADGGNKSKIVQRGLAILDQLKPPPSPGKDFVQRANPRYLSFGDYAPCAPLANTLYTQKHRWRAQLPMAPGQTGDDRHSGGELIPFHLPWVVGNSLYYKHYNRVYCRSLVSGQLRWSFELGPLDRDVGRNIRMEIPAHRLCTVWQREQSILVDEQMVYANIGAFDRMESLVALDRVTGQLQWSAGALQPQDDKDLTMRYDAAPALGRQAVFAPWSFEQGDGRKRHYTTVGVTAFDKRTGRVLWRKELARLAPTATTQERRDIRVYSSPPVVQGGVVYCCTNAGVVAALDADSGAVRWLVRYPHVRKREQWPVLDGHDVFTLQPNSRPEIFSPRFTCQAPLLRDQHLIVAPADGEQVLCFDKETGKALWSITPPERGDRFEGPMVHLAGITGDDELIVAGGELNFHDVRTGQKTWKFLPSWVCTWGSNGGIYYTAAFVDHPLPVLGRPTLTSDGKLYFSGFQGGTISGSRRTFVVGEWCLSTKERKLIDQRWRFGDSYKENSLRGIQQEIQNSKDFDKYAQQTPAEDVNTPFLFEPARRFSFLHHGVPFEIVSDGQSLSGQFDLAALSAAVAKDNLPQSLFIRAEILREEGRDEESAATFKRAKAALKPEERSVLREIDMELYQLYRRQAWKALLAGDGPRLHAFVLQMGQTAVSAEQEIQALLGMAESFERQGQTERAAKCLQLLIQHHARTIYPVNLLTLDDPEKLSAQVGQKLEMLGQRKPKGLAGPFTFIEKMMKGSAPGYLSALVPLEADAELEGETLAIHKLRRLLAKNPKFQGEFERRAAAALDQPDGAKDRPSFAARVQTMRTYPGTKAAQRALDDLLAQESKLAAGPRQVSLWRLGDLSDRLGLVVPPPWRKATRLSPLSVTPAKFSTESVEKKHVFPDAGENLRLIVPIRTTAAGMENRLFIAGRAKKRLDNKFAMECWDLSTWSRRWQHTDIRLLGNGDEAGFEEVFIAPGPGLVITHGQYDVLAFTLDKGKLAWRFRLPLGLDLRTVDQVSDLLIVSGAGNTVALQASTGQVVWQAVEQGELYGRPFLRDGTLISVRRQPFNVSFRQLGSGQPLGRLKMPELSTVTRHPLLPAPKDGPPNAELSMACNGNLLVLTDGQYYIAIDVAKREIRWKRPVDNADLFIGPMRFYLHEPFLLVLKQDFDNPALYLIDTRSGEILWRKKQTDVVHSILFDDDGKTFHGLFVESQKSVTVRRFDTRTGAEKSRWSSAAYKESPDAQLVGKFADGKVIVRIIHAETLDLSVLDMGKQQVAARLSGRCVGGYGAHGGRAAMIQGPHLILMSPEQIQALVPKEGGAP